MTILEYSKALMLRQEVVRKNAGRRIKGLPPLPVPEKPAVPMVRVAYGADGTYMGRLDDDEEAPTGAVVKVQPAKY